MEATQSYTQLHNLRKKRHSLTTDVPNYAEENLRNPQLRKPANPKIRVKRDILRIFSVSFYAEVGMTRAIYSHDIITL